MFFEQLRTRSRAYSVLFVTIGLYIGLPILGSHASSDCEEQCGRALTACQARLPHMQEKRDEPAATRIRRSVACERDSEACKKDCRAGPRTTQQSTPPENCLIVEKPDRRTGLDTACGHNYTELWVVVRNSHSPGCPLPTLFIFTEKINPTEQDEKDVVQGPFAAPLTIQTCGRLPWEIRPALQPVPVAAPPSPIAAPLSAPRSVNLDKIAKKRINLIGDLSKAPDFECVSIGRSTKKMPEAVSCLVIVNDCPHNIRTRIETSRGTSHEVTTEYGDVTQDCPVYNSVSYNYGRSVRVQS